jgi:hypothetical protein
VVGSTCVVLKPGKGITVMVVVAVAVQPFAFVTVTVYVVVEAGVTFMVCIIAPVDQL